MLTHNFHRETVLGVTAEDAYAWHTRPGALGRLLPPWQDTRILESGGGVRNGSRVVLDVPVGPLRRRWVAEHRRVEPGRRFEDVQVQGPFAAWIHKHTFEPRDDASCALRDEIDYRLPGGAAGRAFGGAPTRRMLDRVFAYRHATVADDLALCQRYTDRPRMTVAVSGAGGLVGSVLRAMLSTGGHEVRRLVRDERAGDGETIHWNVREGITSPEQLSGVGAIVHLAGENIGAGRWSRARMEEIRRSRVDGTRALVASLRDLDRRPETLICASAIGYYGDRGEALVDESSRRGTGFLAELCADWEAAAEAATELGMRVVRLRFGVVLSPAGGMLGQLLGPFRKGGGGPVGSGRQFMSWVSIDDAAGAIVHAVMTPELAGPLNVVAPEPVTNATFARTLGRVLRRPAILRVPAPLARLAFGRMADEAILASTRVDARRLRESGYRLRHPTLEPTLRHLLGRPA